MNAKKLRFGRAAGKREADDELDELLVFGYASQIYANDERAEWIAEGRHLIAHPADCQLLIDRYDCRLHLLSAEALDVASVAPDQETMKSGGNGNGYECPAELLEEEMCEEERYKDMQEDIARLEQEEEDKQKRTEIAFNYDESSKAASSSSEEEIDEPFQPPENIKLPLGMNLPDTMKQNAVIERTAIFVVAQGPQMEIVIKAKQRGSQDQFGFLEFDHPLNAYYKYISKMIREKKYVPRPHIPSRRPKLKKLKRLEEEKRLAEENKTDKNSSSNSDSDSDSTGNYLHPLLMGGARKIDSRSSSPVIGPKTREESDAVGKKQSQVKIDYKLGKADDMYSSLFKNLSDLVVAHIKPTHSAGTSNQDAEIAKKEVEKGEYYEWYLTFYGEPPPCNEQPNVIPPPPDIMPSVNSAAEYVSRYGVQAEQLLLGRQDLNVGFLHPGEPYHGYYHSRIRHYQKLHSSYLQSQKILRNAEEGDDGFKQEVIDMGGNEMEQSIVVGDDFNHEQPTTLAKSFSDLLQAPPPPPPFMNRKMRRRGFHDPPRTPDPVVPDNADIAEIGVVDFDISFSKVQSSPALLDSAVERESLSPPTRKVPSGPISFSLNIQKVDDRKVPKTASAVKLGAYEDEESGGTEMVDVPPGVLNNIPPPGLTIPPPPVAPVPLSSGQLAAEGSAELQSERKLKARLFMERILNEKRAAKLRAQNEEQQKRDNELLKKYEETRGTSTSSPMTKSKNKDTMDDLDMSISASAIDQLINLRIDKVINETFKGRGDRKHSKSHHKKEKKKRYKRRGENRHSDEDDDSVEKSSKHSRRRSCDKSDSPDQKVSSRRKKRKKRRHHRSSSSNGDR